VHCGKINKIFVAFSKKQYNDRSKWIGMTAYEGVDIAESMLINDSVQTYH
jgi:hypothetical protein